MSKKINLNKHQRRMVCAIRNRNIKELSSMTSFFLEDAMLSSIEKYRNEVTKRLNRLFPLSIQYLKLNDDSIFELARDFHFDHPERVLHKKISQISKRIKSHSATDPVLDDLIKIELAIALIYYTAIKDDYKLHGVPLSLKTNLWKFYPNYRNPEIKSADNKFNVRFNFDPYLSQLFFFPDPFAKGRLSEKGDPHNFGQRTERHGERFLKPREMFWEYFFLSKKSPLKKILPQPLADSVLALDISLEERTSKRIKKSRPKDFKEFWKTSGKLCAWSSLFGMCDLHRGNVIINEKGPIIIDLETTLLSTYEFNTSGLIDTLSNEMKWATGYAEVFELSREPETKFDVNLVLDGFNEVFNWSLANQKRLFQLFKEYEQDISNADNRFILRNSREYEKQNNKFIPEEVLQLKRGDVPYFFTHRNKKKILLKKDAVGNNFEYTKQAPQFAKKLLSLHVGSIYDVISTKRIRHLRKNGEITIREYFCVN